MKRTFIYVILLSVAVTGCSPKRYHEPAFGGLKGKVESVKTWYLMPELWRSGTSKSFIEYITVAAYDPSGHEICSALLDSLENIQSEAVNIFDNNLCIRSTEKSYGLLTGELSIVSVKGSVFEYDYTAANKTTRLSIKERYRFNRSRTVISEDGKPVSERFIRTDRYGYPVEVTVKDLVKGIETRDVNTYDESHNIVEKHSITPDGEEVLFTSYTKFDEKGNWIEAIVVNKYNLPVNDLYREIKYW
ncbi:MAG: hypothetical protein IK006_08850 [Bacteroidaceae bacterium]|nr:hypothetical protein [Bacteroidaceae bacterium]